MEDEQSEQLLVQLASAFGIPMQSASDSDSDAAADDDEL